MNDPNLSTLLKWGIENSDASKASAADAPRTQLTPEVLAALLGHVKSEPEMMKENMDVIDDDNAKIKDRRIAFENFKILVENIDNANIMPTLKGPRETDPDMWTRLLRHLENADTELREYAALSCKEAVQNNIKSQERLLVNGGLHSLVKMATEDPEQSVRKKAVSALSSAVRNFQPGLDAVISKLPTEYKPTDKLDASDMDSVDTLISKLRENV